MPRARWSCRALIPTVACFWMAVLLALLWSPHANAAYRLHFRNGGTAEVPSYQDTGDAISYPRFGGTISVPKTDLLQIEDLTPAPPAAAPPPPTSEPSRQTAQPPPPVPAGPGWWFTFAGKFYEHLGVTVTGRQEIRVWEGPLEVGPFGTRQDCQRFHLNVRGDRMWQGKIGDCRHAKEPIYRVYTPTK